MNPFLVSSQIGTHTHSSCAKVLTLSRFPSADRRLSERDVRIIEEFFDEGQAHLQFIEEVIYQAAGE